MSIFSSSGLKRYLSAIISAIASVLAVLPGTGPAILVLQSIATALGVAGLANATAKGTVVKFSAGSIAAAIATLITICNQFPALAKYVPVLQMLALLFGGAAVDKGTASKETSSSL